MVRVDNSEVERQVDAIMEAEETVLDEATGSIVFGGAVQGSPLGGTNANIQSSTRTSTRARQKRAADAKRESRRLR